MSKRFLTTLHANDTTCIIGLERSSALDRRFLPLFGKVPSSGNPDPLLRRQ
jgi:hypothetical protein